MKWLNANSSEPIPTNTYSEDNITIVLSVSEFETIRQLLAPVEGESIEEQTAKETIAMWDRGEDIDIITEQEPVNGETCKHKAENLTCGSECVKEIDNSLHDGDALEALEQAIEYFYNRPAHTWHEYEKKYNKCPSDVIETTIRAQLTQNADNVSKQGVGNVDLKEAIARVWDCVNLFNEEVEETVDQFKNSHAMELIQENLNKDDRWLPIDEMHDDYKSVIAYPYVDQITGKLRSTVGFHDDDGSWRCNITNNIFQPTYYMEIPKFEVK